RRRGPRGRPSALRSASLWRRSYIGRPTRLPTWRLQCKISPASPAGGWACRVEPMDILALRRRAAEALSEEQRSGALRALLAQQATAAGAPQDTAVTQVAFLQQYVETAVADLDAAWV